MKCGCHTCRSISAIFSWSAWCRFNINFWMRFAWEGKGYIYFFSPSHDDRYSNNFKDFNLLIYSAVQWRCTCSSKLADLRFSSSRLHWRSVSCWSSFSEQQWPSVALFLLIISVFSCCLSFSTSISLSLHLHINWSVMLLATMLTFSNFVSTIFFLTAHIPVLGCYQVLASYVNLLPELLQLVFGFL